MKLGEIAAHKGQIIILSKKLRNAVIDCMDGRIVLLEHLVSPLLVTYIFKH
jgi:hypothetical protein